jgi:hypothetical protein
VIQLSSDWVNPCGGKKWRTLPNGAIEVEGEGVPVYSPTSLEHKYLTQTWTNWAPQFESSAARFDVPVTWILAAATQETGLWSNNPERQRTIGSTDGHSSIGIMQPIPSTATMLGYSAADRYDPQLNIDMGAKLMGKTLNASGFPAVAAKYNAGHACNVGNDRFNLAGHKGQYASNVLRYNNTALALGLGAAKSSLASTLGWSLLGAGAVLGIGLVILPRIKR